jgi:UDP-3-O-[3-hydroxymyristoyl] glucosamine N-acyltransferase
VTGQEIATLVGGEVSGDPGVRILKVSKIEEAGEGDLTFLSNPRYEKHVATTRASAILVAKGFNVELHAKPGLTFIRVPDPYVAFLQILKKLTPQADPFLPGIHPTAVVDPSATVASGAALGAHVVVGRGARIGANSRIGPCCVIGDGAAIGDECQLFPNVTVYHDCQVGHRVIIHGGTVIGSDGFGFAPKPDGTYEKIPQMGIVVVEDDVELGANCTIDRATMGQTVIKQGAKLDNLVHIAHNVIVGENTVIAAQTGVSGSTKIGKNVMLAGQVGIVGHIEIADRSIVMAQSGISKSTQAGKTYFGFPAKEHVRALKIEAVIRSLPELAKDVEELKKLVKALKDDLTSHPS